MLDPREAFGLGLLSLQVAQALPLLNHAWKSKSGEGIALSTETFVIASGIGWAGYGILTDSPILAISGSLGIVAALVLLFLIWPSTTTSARLRAFGLSGLMIVTYGVFYLVGGTLALATALSISALVQFLPQILESAHRLVTRRKARGANFKVSTLRATYTLAWAGYAVGWQVVGASSQPIDWPLLAWGLGGTLAYGLQALTADTAQPAEEALGHLVERIEVCLEPTVDGSEPSV